MQNLTDCVKVLTIEWYPYTTINKLPKGGPVYAGVYFEMLFSAAKKFKFCYDVTASVDQTWGNFVNGSFNGAIGVIQKKEADILLTPSSMSYERNLVVGFSDVVEVSSHTILYRYPEREPDYAGFVRPFSLNTWILIIASSFLLMGIFGIIFWITDAFKKRLDGRNRESDVSNHALFMILGGLTSSQPPRFKFDSEAARIATCIWIMCIFIVGSVYRSNLAAMLTTPKLKIPFETLEEAIVQKQLTLIVNIGTYLDQTIKTYDKGTALGTLNNVAAHMFANKIDYDGVFDANTHALVMIRGGIDYFIQRAFTKYGHCVRTKIPQTFLPVSMAVVFQKNSTLQKNFNKIVAGYTESGIFDYLLQKGLPNVQFCLIQKGEISRDVRALTISDFFGIFLFLGTGMTLATISFLLEILIKKITRREQTPIAIMNRKNPPEKILKQI